jgi:hypothetical protein
MDNMKKLVFLIKYIMRRVLEFVNWLDTYLRPWETMHSEVYCAGMAQERTLRHRRSGKIVKDIFFG